MSRNIGSEWYKQAAANPYGAAGTGNYTNGVFDGPRTSIQEATRATAIRLSQAMVTVPMLNQWPHPRNLACDIAPTLYHSVQEEPSNYATTTWYAWWGEKFLDSTLNGGQAFLPYAPDYQDVFHANPWYHSFLSGSHGNRDNRYVYSDTSKPETLTQLGTVNPPLTLTQGGRIDGPKSYLFTDDPYNPQRHGIYIFDFSPQQLWTYTVDSYGIAAGETFGWISGSEWHGVRYNLEVVDDDDEQWGQDGVPQNNLQTFLVVQGETQAAAPLTVGEAKGGRADKTLALFLGSAMAKKFRIFRSQFTKKYRSKR